ncbi:MAG: hypothetical protein AAF458_06075 [Pseudomonadota bacterium]
MTDNIVPLNPGSDAAELPDDPVARARAELQLCLAAQRDLSALSDDVAALEVECIEADLATGKSATGLDLSPQDAARLGTILSRRDALQAELQTLIGRKPADELSPDAQTARMEAGITALQNWLDAPHVQDSKKAATLARIVLLMATFIVGWGAWILHPALLLLLIPIAGPISLMLRRGENTEWRRMGARQKFEQTGLEIPAAWEQEPVEARVKTLSDQLERARSAPAQVEDITDEEARKDTRFAELSIEQVDIELALDKLLEKAGVTLETLTDKQHAALEQAAAGARARQRLEQIRKQHETLKRENEDRKDGIYRMLSAEGVAPPEGRADIAALSAGISELESRG